MENKKSKGIIIVLCILIAVLLVICGILLAKITFKISDDSESKITTNSMTAQVTAQTTTEKQIETIDFEASVLGSDINDWLEKIPDLKYYGAGGNSPDENFENNNISFGIFDGKKVCNCTVNYPIPNSNVINFTAYGLDNSNNTDDVKAKFDNIIYEDDESICVDLSQNRYVKYIFDENKKIKSVMFFYPD